MSVSKDLYVHRTTHTTPIDANLRKQATDGNKEKEFPRPSLKYRSARLGSEKTRHPRPSRQFSSARFLAHIERAGRATKAKGGILEELEKRCKKNTEDIRALEAKYEELHSMVEALQRELRGGSNSVDQI